MAQGIKGSTVPLRDRWSAYRTGKLPADRAGRIRAALLRHGSFTPRDKGETDHAYAVASAMRRLGYTIRKDGDQFICANPGHEPTAADWERFYAYDRATRAASNGASPARPTTRRRALPAAGMLPAVGDSLVVVGVGIGRDGTPYLHAESASGWRFGCSISTADAPAGP